MEGFTSSSITFVCEMVFPRKPEPWHCLLSMAIPSAHLSIFWRGVLQLLARLSPWPTVIAALLLRTENKSFQHTGDTTSRLPSRVHCFVTVTLAAGMGLQLARLEWHSARGRELSQHLWDLSIHHSGKAVVHSFRNRSKITYRYQVLQLSNREHSSQQYPDIWKNRKTFTCVSNQTLRFEIQAAITCTRKDPRS